MYEAGPYGSSNGADQDDQSALKMRRNKKNSLTAARALGKVTGRWTEEEHQRFNEGKVKIQIFQGF